jgi:hypothetical protein
VSAARTEGGDERAAARESRSSDGAAPRGSGSAVYFATCAAVIGFALCYALPIYARLQRPYYDPIMRRWFIADHAPPIPMGYLGQIAWAVAGALVAGGVAWALTSGRRAPTARAHTLAAAWALTAIAIVVAYFTWNNWP